jgi:lipopolysaccharide/colanic/teichoic acid biosynthesis glycosyltransferase
LRITRLDELPQLWNVIKGDMSLIGPRAEWSKLIKEYEKEIPLYHLRHMVKPGITGWAQVNYGYGTGLRDTKEKLQYDLYYIKHYSVGMDAAIVLKTLFTMLSAAGQ